MFGLKNALCGSALAVIVGLPTLAAAQDDSITLSSSVIEIDLQGMTVTLPRPSWSKGSGLQSEVYQDTPQDGVSIVELVPEGDTFAGWTHMQAALLVAQPGYGTSAMIDSVVQAFDGGCEKDSLQYGTVRPKHDEGPEVLAVACGAYLAGAGGGDPGMGEIMLFTVIENEFGAMKVYEEWRGPAFDPSDMASWPVDQAELQRQADAMQDHAGFVPAGN